MRTIQYLLIAISFLSLTFVSSCGSGLPASDEYVRFPAIKDAVIPPDQLDSVLTKYGIDIPFYSLPQGAAVHAVVIQFDIATLEPGEATYDKVMVEIDIAERFGTTDYQDSDNAAVLTAIPQTVPLSVEQSVNVEEASKLEANLAAEVSNTVSKISGGFIVDETRKETNARLYRAVTWNNPTLTHGSWTFTPFKAEPIFAGTYSVIAIIEVGDPTREYRVSVRSHCSYRVPTWFGLSPKSGTCIEKSGELILQQPNPPSVNPPPFVTITETSSAPTLTPGPSPLQTETIEQGAAMVIVPAGEFTMGSDAGNADAKPAHTVYLDAYYIDKFEVTNSLYAACVSAGACKKPAELDFPGYGPYYDDSKYADFPVVFVDWFRANAYCEWRGAHLPTEAQWEKAASWDPRTNLKRLYPWGDQNPGCDRANFGCQFGTSKVGDYGIDKSQYGVFDMAGNVREWVADWYSSNFYEAAPSRNANTAGPSQSNTGTRVFRGGSWATTAAFAARTFERNRQNDTYSSRDLGLRCARPATP